MIKFWKPYIWTLTILYLSFLPSDQFPEIGIINFDKFVHMIIYFVQTFLFITAFYRKFPDNKKKYLLYPFLICITTGMVTELLQGTKLINRHADWLDLLANSIGVMIAVVSFILLIKKNFIKKNIKWL